METPSSLATCLIDEYSTPSILTSFDLETNGVLRAFSIGQPLRLNKRLIAWASIDLPIIHVLNNPRSVYCQCGLVQRSSKIREILEH